jgi:hypothetical protein
LDLSALGQRPSLCNQHMLMSRDSAPAQCWNVLRIPYVRRYLDYYLTQMIGPSLQRPPAYCVADCRGERIKRPTPFQRPTQPGSLPAPPFIQNFIGATSLPPLFALSSPLPPLPRIPWTIDGRDSHHCLPRGMRRPSRSCVDLVSPPAASWPVAPARDCSRQWNNLLTFRMYERNGAQVGATWSMRSQTGTLRRLSSYLQPGFAET